MKVSIQFFLLNENFSQEHADAQHNGLESEHNPKFEWEDEFALKNDISNIIIERDSNYDLRGQYSDGSLFCHPIPNSVIFRFIEDNGFENVMAVSECLVENIEESGDNQLRSIKVFLQETSPIVNPIHGHYFASELFPSELWD